MENSTSKKGSTIRQTNILPKKARYKTIWYSQDDYATILALSIQRGVPITQVAHDLITDYLVCQKQAHAKIIERLKEDRLWIAAELKLYIDYFGKLPASARLEKRK
ncbi:MAG TPA: hypothetical protein VF318_02090 [Dehalococcoidales bacterium]